MNKKNPLYQFFQKKNLNPMDNRKKVGIILFATSIGLFFLFAARLIFITAGGTVAGTSLDEKTAELYQGKQVLKAQRGAILDRNGEVIVEDATSYSLIAILSKNYLGINNKKLYAEPSNFEEIAAILAKNTPLSREEALGYLKNGVNEDGTTKYQVEFGNNGKNISLDQRLRIEKDLKQAGIKGIYFIDHPARMYPNGVFASHFIGYTDLADPADETEGLVGKMGLEESYNAVLSGKDGSISYQKDVEGNPIPGTVKETSAENGKDIYTTLDNRLQSRLEVLMDGVVEKYEPLEMTAMLAEAKTGNILAMTQRPSFNPETKEGLDTEDSVWRNILIEDAFEPGSTMKIFTSAAAMQEGVFHPDEAYVYPPGGYKLEDRTVNDHDFGAIGTLTFRQALSWSSNVGMITLEQRMGGTTWKNYMEKFGFGKSTDSGLTNESPGFIPRTNYVDQAMSAFGQGVSVTSFQMMQGFTAFANNGTMLKPQYISKIVDPNNGAVEKKERQEIATPVSAEAVNNVRSYLVDTVENPTYGIAYNVYTVPGYHIAAKTGTAQIQSGEGGYLKGITDYIYSVVEMVPAEDPEYILYLTMKQPKRYDRTALAEIGNPLLKLAMDLK